MRSNGQHCNVNPSDFGLVVNRFRYLVCRKGKIMAVNTIGYWNASYVFESIELNDEDQEQFIEKFTKGDENTALTLVSRYKFFKMLTDFVKDLEDEEPKEAVLAVSCWYPEAKYINIEE